MPGQVNSPQTTAVVIASGATGGPLYLTKNGAGAPPYSFAGDTDTGWDSDAANTISGYTSGTLRFTLNTAALTSTLPLKLSETGGAVLTITQTATELTFVSAGGAAQYMTFDLGSGTGAMSLETDGSITFLKRGVGTWWKIQSAGQLVAGANYRFAHGTSALATTATEGFLHLQSCAGTPTGVPASIPSGQIPMVFDTTGVKLWLYTGGAWKGVVVA